MNKKFLSAILFGALMVTSTGTFVSCKDYDDDIKDLQGQINSNKDAIAALQKLVGEGKWVTNITSIENGFTVTMSDGTSQNVTGIKGADGKNGTEWTIGEDGFWYKDGEKTTSQAVAKDGEDGKAGATAPSPKINADGFWVIYELDATTGEFVEKTTEISAAGTSAYYVMKNGVYYLNIADETGKFAEIALPATSDGFVVEAPYSFVKVIFDYAKWNPTASNDFKTLSAKFPDIAKIEKNALVKQGGNLPVLVTPASVELTDDFSYSLQQINGKTADIKISTPVKGLPAGADIEEGGMVTRAADASACFWTLSIEPSIVNKEYVQVSEKPASLVVENAKGTVVKTTFAYGVFSNKLTDKAVAINPVSVTTGSATYAAEIDLLAYDEKQKSYPIYIENGYVGYQIITLTNKYQIEKYGLSIADDNRTLKIANMPADVTGITVDLNVLALGLNGSTAKKDVTIKIGQEVSASANLSAKALTLNGQDQIIKWNISELGLSAVDLDKVLSGSVNVTVTREYTDASDNDAYEVVFYSNAENANQVVYYNAAGEVTKYNNSAHSWTNKDAATFGITLNASKNVTGNLAKVQIGEHQYVAGAVAAPAEYNVSLTSKEGTTVIYSAETTLTTSLPEVQTSFIKLADGFVENGVLQVIGTVSDNNVTYDLNQPFVLKNVTIDGFVDMDFDENETSTTSTAYYNWVPEASKGVAGKSLTVNVWKTKKQVEDAKLGEWSAAKWNQLYVTRNLRANIYFFGNELNAAVYDFKATVKSTIYSNTPKSVVTITDSKMVSNYGGDAIDIKKAIDKAVYAAGPKKGQTYKLFDVAGTTSKIENYADYDVYNDATKGVKFSGDYVVDANGAPVAITKADLTKLGMSAAYYAAMSATDVIYMYKSKQTLKKTVNGVEITTTVDGWTEIMTVVNKYYGYNGKGEWTITKNNPKTDKTWTAADITADGGDAYIALFNAYKAKLAFNKSKEVTLDPVKGESKDAALNTVTVEFADAAEAAKYVTPDLKNFKVTPKAVKDITEAPEKVTIPMNLVVNDIWGMTMKVPFNVTVQTTKP